MRPVEQKRLIRSTLRRSRALARYAAVPDPGAPLKALAGARRRLDRLCARLTHVRGADRPGRPTWDEVQRALADHDRAIEDLVRTAEKRAPGLVLAALRAHLGMTQQAFAAMLAVVPLHELGDRVGDLVSLPPDVVRRWERGAAAPAPVIRLAIVWLAEAPERARALLEE